MGLFLVAAAPSWILSILTVMLTILKVALGLGMVIFVHELGHFVVAKLCGVKCEKFYLGFDIAGLKLARFTYGETEYGIGILPLGGYVKMLGQEDNPARLREELERARALQQTEGGSTSATTAPAAANASEPPLDLARAQEALYDPRSYLAKSVPKRMAIISAGVLMNALFAVLIAIGAYAIGVQQISPVVGGVAPGDGAWRAGVQVGDRILQVGDAPVRTFNDISAAISLGDSLEGARILLERPGRKEPFWVVAKAQKTGLAPTIGVISSMVPTLALPALPGTAAASAAPALQAGDRLLAINEQPVGSYADVARYLAQWPEKTLQLSLERDVAAAGQAETAPKKTQRLTVSVPPAKMRQLGLVMQMGPITAIQAGSPAEKAGLKPGDLILRVNGQAVGDPLRFAGLLDELARTDKPVMLHVQRAEGEPRNVEVSLRKGDEPDAPSLPHSPAASSALGVAYEVTNQLKQILPGSPAAQAGLRVGDVVAQATLDPPDAKELQKQGLDKLAGEISQKATTIDLTQPLKGTWPYLMSLLQQSLPGTRVTLTLKSGRVVSVEPQVASDWFNPDRGFLCEPQMFEQRAQSWGEAVRLGIHETREALTMVFRTVQRLLDNQVSPKGLMGPVGIAKVAYYKAAQGIGEFLLFLTMLSANLAVLNFLPIPVLDGGHMVFLAYEGITRKPPSERVQLSLSYLGLLLLLSLMIWVVLLDVGLVARQ